MVVQLQETFNHPQILASFSDSLSNPNRHFKTSISARYKLLHPPSVRLLFHSLWADFNVRGSGGACSVEALHLLELPWGQMFP